MKVTNFPSFSFEIHLSKTIKFYQCLISLLEKNIWTRSCNSTKDSSTRSKWEIEREIFWLLPESSIINMFFSHLIQKWELKIQQLITSKEFKDILNEENWRDDQLQDKRKRKPTQEKQNQLKEEACTWKTTTSDWMTSWNNDWRKKEAPEGNGGQKRG